MEECRGTDARQQSHKVTRRDKTDGGVLRYAAFRYGAAFKSEWLNQTVSLICAYILAG